MGLSVKHFYEFGPYRLDAIERILLRHDEHVPLTPKSFEILLVLVENGGHVIDKDELIKKVWSDKFVEEVNLARNIYSLRKVLGGEDTEHYIETIPKRGYRFVVGVREVWVEQATSSGPNGITSGPLVSRESKVEDEIKSEDDVERKPGFASTDLLHVSSLGMNSVKQLTLTNLLGLPSIFFMLGVVFSVAVWLIALRPYSKAPLTHPRITPVTSFPGSEDQAAFSSDGNQVAFVWNGEKEDNFDIYVKLIGAETPLRLTTHPAPDTDPAWSPDGRYLSFFRQSADKGGFFMVPALGGAERELGEAFPYRPVIIGNTLSYSPDGKYLAVPDKHLQEEPFSIFLISIETREKIKLTSPPAASVGDFFPAFSPDQKTLAFVRSASIATTDIYLLPIAGGEPKRLTFDNMSIRGLSWTSNGREIVFASRRGGSVYHIWKILAAGGVPEPLTVAERDAYSPTVSRQGNRLAYTQSLLDENIWRIGLNGPVASGEPPVELISSTQAEDSPSYSPDGKKIAFVSRRSGSFEIWVCESDGSRPGQLTNIGGPLTGTPRWSPDGQHIAFNSWLEGNSEIYLISANGGKPHRLTFDPAEDVTPSWSRDGRWVYFGSSRSGRMQGWKVPAAGGQAVQVTKQGGFEGFESHDGQYFYYAKGRAVPGIFRVPVEGGEEILVLDHHKAGLWRYWAVADKGIYFATAETPSHPVVEFFNFANGMVTRVTTLNKPLLRTTPGLAVSPDGRWLLIAQMDQGSKDIMLMENFR